MKHFGIASLAAAALALAGCDKEPGVAVENAWVRLPPIPERPGAAYFTVEATGMTATLTAAESAAAERAEIHETRQEGDRSAMVPLGSVEVPADGTLAFEPGGRHVMLFGLDPALQPGATIPLTLRFAGHPPVTVEAELRAPGDAPAHAGH